MLNRVAVYKSKLSMKRKKLHSSNRFFQTSEIFYPFHYLILDLELSFNCIFLSQNHLSYIDLLCLIIITRSYTTFLTCKKIIDSFPYIKLYLKPHFLATQPTARIINLSSSWCWQSSHLRMRNIGPFTHYKKRQSFLI